MKGHSVAAPLLSTRWAKDITWAAALLALTVQACGTEETLMEKAKQFFKPLLQDMATAEFPTLAPRVELGKKLFFDPRLSADGTVACATCHRPALYGTDGLPKSIGVEDRVNARNSPTVLNAALQFKAHCIGDRANVEEQAMKSLLGHASFGNPDNAAVIRKIKALPGYEEAFAQALPNEKEPVQPESWGKAIGAYERTLVTPSLFDASLEGDPKALTPQAQAGLKLFIDVGCVSCHNGVAIGGATFQKFGDVGDYWKETGSQAIDEGRYQETQDPADKYVFKVPSLRNVSMTPPYFHDGSVATLPHAVRVMAKVQLSKTLTEGQVHDVVAFLQSLTGSVPKEFATEPVLAPQAFGATQP